ncbi:hypothetical protein [Flammeovirga sp. SJP92]|uniref:hypothetical protein n=1 Tax=Flammeovirga sp. SJP92 TaxID=1775430 RepID=UPI0012FBA258|nr:hypothetical protein [Flammeovirga sp. SJP92]
MKKEKYVIVTAADVILLSKKVNKKIDENYKPIGGILITPVGHVFHQAMLLST